MSITFRPTVEASGKPLLRCSCDDISCPACRIELNMNERNARDLLEYLGLSREGHGTIPAAEMASRCEVQLAKLRPESARPTVETHRGPNAVRVIEGGRPAGYLRDRTAELHRIALAAQDWWISWG